MASDSFWLVRAEEQLFRRIGANLGYHLYVFAELTVGLSLVKGLSLEGLAMKEIFRLLCLKS